MPIYSHRRVKQKFLAIFGIRNWDFYLNKREKNKLKKDVDRERSTVFFMDGPLQGIRTLPGKGERKFSFYFFLTDNLVDFLGETQIPVLIFW